jgi:hypothetical protein
MLTLAAACLFATLSVAQPPAEPVGASTLHANYAANALDADLKYKDKAVTVEGVILKVEPEAGGRYAARMMVALGRGGRPVAGVVCRIAAGAEGDFRNLPTNGTTRVTGTCRGLQTDYTAYKGKVVVLDDCRRAK